ncbi:MAG: cytochrome-c peroxidase [Rhizobiaceae bacterium]
MNVLKVVLAACGSLYLINTNPALAEDAAEIRAELRLSDDEIAKIIRHGPWPPVQKTDPSNRVSGKRSAIELGELLFFDTGLSADGQIACGTCHDPALGWTDGKARAGGLARLDRNTQSLFNVSGNRWFGWDGRNDSLWGHSIGPILDKKEMGATPDMIAARVRNDRDLNRRYAEVFGIPPEKRETLDLVVDVAKSMAAFQETIVTGRTTFDEFRDALARKDNEAALTYPASARRGASLFVGKGQCNLCHIGPRFTNDEFDDAGVPYFIAPGRVDRGRFKGIQDLKASPFNLLGKYNDASGEATGWATARVSQTHRTFGQFKVPSLRQLTETAPYMHDGSLETLRNVVDHYSTIDLERIHSDGVLVLRPLNLTEQESQDLVAFLKSLSTR